jgi:hypothetical protein
MSPRNCSIQFDMTNLHEEQRCRWQGIYSLDLLLCDLILSRANLNSNMLGNQTE